MYIVSVSTFPQTSIQDCHKIGNHIGATKVEGQEGQPPLQYWTLNLNNYIGSVRVHVYLISCVHVFATSATDDKPTR